MQYVTPRIFHIGSPQLDLDGLQGYLNEIGAPDWQDGDEFKNKIITAITIKVITSPLYKELCECTLPFKHYYTYGTKVIEPKDGKWILEHLESFKND